MSAKMANQPLLPDFLNRIWRRRRVFGMTFAAVVAVTLALLLVLPVRYMATGSIIVAEQEPNSNDVQAAWAQKIGDPADLESQLLVIRSPRVLRLAMTQPGVAEAAVEDCIANSRSVVPGSTERCERIAHDSAAFVDYVQSRFSIGAVGRSRVINISYSSGNPKVAQIMANALTTSFLDDQRAAGSNSREVAAAWLRRQIGELDAELKSMEEKIQAFRQSKGLMRGATAPINSERLTSVSQQLSAAEAARADAAAKLREVKAGEAQGTSDAPSVLASRTVADLKQQLTTISAQYASLSNVLGPKHPTLLALEREQASVKQRLADEIATIVASLQKTYDTNDALVTALKKQMDSIKADVGAATSDEASIESMVRAADIKRQQYADLSRRASELETERRILLGSTRLVSLAELPSVPFFPKKLPFLAAGATLGLLFAILAVLVSEHLPPFRIWPSPGPMSRKPGVSLAAAVSALSGWRTSAPKPVEQPQPAAVVAESRPAESKASAEPAAPAKPVLPEPAPVTLAAQGPEAELALVIDAATCVSLPMLKPATAESPIHAILNRRPTTELGRALEIAAADPTYQAALAQLASGLGLAPGAHREVLLTAAEACEGNTVLTLSLARHLAARGCRVLALECNLARPRFSEAIPCDPVRGLLSVLRGEAEPRAVLTVAGGAGFDVIGAGHVSTGNPTSWLLRQEMSAVLDWARSYDVVLIDGPASPLHADAGWLTSKADAVLLCASLGQSATGSLVAAASAIRRLGGRIAALAVRQLDTEDLAADLAAAERYNRVG